MICGARQRSWRTRSRLRSVEGVSGIGFCMGAATLVSWAAAWLKVASAWEALVDEEREKVEKKPPNLFGCGGRSSERLAVQSAAAPELISPRTTTRPTMTTSPIPLAHRLRCGRSRRNERLRELRAVMCRAKLRLCRVRQSSACFRTRQALGDFAGLRISPMESPGIVLNRQPLGRASAARASNVANHCDLASGKPRARHAQADKRLELERVIAGATDKPHVILLGGHPDPDAIGSALAHRRICERLGVSATIAHVLPLSRSENRALVKLLNVPMVRVDEAAKISRSSATCRWSTRAPASRASSCPSTLELLTVVDHHRPTSMPQGALRRHPPRRRRDLHDLRRVRGAGPRALRRGRQRRRARWPRPCSSASRRTPTTSPSPRRRTSARPPT